MEIILYAFLIITQSFYCPSLLYHSKYDSFRHILYKISKKIAKVKRPRFGASNLFCKNIQFFARLIYSIFINWDLSISITIKGFRFFGIIQQSLLFHPNKNIFLSYYSFLSHRIPSLLDKSLTKVIATTFQQFFYIISLPKAHNHLHWGAPQIYPNAIALSLPAILALHQTQNTPFQINLP